MTDDLKTPPAVQEYRTKHIRGGHRWRVRARNGRIIGASTEDYTRPAAARENRRQLLAGLLAEEVETDPTGALAPFARAMLARLGYHVGEDR